jgi:hypothetical protein
MLHYIVWQRKGKNSSRTKCIDVGSRPATRMSKSKGRRHDSGTGFFSDTRREVRPIERPWTTRVDDDYGTLCGRTMNRGLPNFPNNRHVVSARCPLWILMTSRRLDDRHISITYSDSEWVPEDSSASFNDTLTVTSTPGATAQIDFEGTSTVGLLFI